jgi:hypothetical protein
MILAYEDGSYGSGWVVVAAAAAVAVVVAAAAVGVPPPNTFSENVFSSK